jgi:Kdo2-lipid IVA lauroyltransferase/acyltransferase
MKHRPKHVAEYVLLRAVCGLVALLPYRLALALAWGIARLAFSLFRWRRREAIRRIQSVLGGTPREARRIAWQSLRNMAFSLAEMIYMGGARPRPLPRPVDMQAALERFRAYTAANPGRGGIFACPHMGNWELAGVVAPTCRIDMFTITGLQKNPLVNAYLQQLRHAPGVELLERGTPNLLRKVLANLRAGKFLAIMPDLRSRQPGVPVRFFGGEVNLYPGTAQFARQAGIPVFPRRHETPWLDPPCAGTARPLRTRSEPSPRTRTSPACPKPSWTSSMPTSARIPASGSGTTSAGSSIPPTPDDQ